MQKSPPEPEDQARTVCILKYGHVSGVYTDEEIAQDLKRTVAAMLRDGIPRRQIVEETSALYGIPAECVEEVVAATGEADCDPIPGFP